MRGLVVFAIVLGLVFAPMSAYAHSGGTDSNGCHVGHCHGGGGGGSGDGAGAAVAVVVVLVVVVLLGVGVAALANSDPTATAPQLDPIPDRDFPVRVDGWTGEDEGGLMLEVSW